jgi:hypothetical protein
MNPAVTVLTTCHPGREEVLKDAAASVAAQDYDGELTHIIAHDRHQLGGAAMYNSIIPLVTSPWIAFLDSDDLFMPHHISTLVTASAFGADLVYPWFNMLGGSDPLGARGKTFDPEALHQANYIPITVLVRTDLVKKVSGFPLPGTPECPVGCYDWDLWERLLKVGCRFLHVDEITWTWRHWGYNTSGIG